MIRLPGKFGIFAVCLFPLLLLVANVFAQETTAASRER